MSYSNRDGLVLPPKKDFKTEGLWEMDIVNATSAMHSLMTAIARFYPRHIKVAGSFLKPPTIIWTTRGYMLNDISESLEYEETEDFKKDPKKPLFLARFPGMQEMCSKDGMAHRINIMKELFPSHFEFSPPTWNLQQEMGNLEKIMEKNKAYLVKTGCGARGNGVSIVFNPKQAFEVAQHFKKKKKNDDLAIVLQEYLPNPLLLDGYKFDFRLYVILTSLNPLSVHIVREGLVRMCTAEYRRATPQNSQNVYMHFCNYSLNKANSYTSKKNNLRIKRCASEVLKELEKKYEGFDAGEFWQDVDEMATN